jgi:uncharacterized membrane protein SpoIIM required for sporulation
LRSDLPAQAVFSSRVLTNNIGVTFTALASGVLAGIGTALVLVYNGLVTGATAGLAVEVGNGRALVDFTFAHGILELSCIVVAAGAGLRLGWAIVDPGYRRRRDALTEEARGAVEIVLGTAPWLVVAGLVEGFIRPAGLGTVAVVVIGIGLGALYWGLVWVLGGDERKQTGASLL